jgi:O-antigen/teichoic acid export membrane protein
MSWLARIADFRGLVRLRAFDVSSAEGRSRERYLRVALSALATGLARVVTMVTLLVSVPLMLTQLGQERYGVWATLASLLVLLNFADLGLGSGVMNTIAGARARDDETSIAANVSSAFVLLCGIGALLLASAAAAFSFVNWPAVFNVSQPLAIRESAPAAAAFLVCAALAVPLGLISRIHAGYQETYLASLWQAAGSLVALLGVVIAATSGAGLPWFVLALAGGPLLASGGNAVWLFGKRRPWLLPRVSLVRRPLVGSLMRTGAVFFVLQLCAAVSYQAATLIIARIEGAAAVPLYSVPMTLFQISPAILGLVMMPLWPAYAESMARGDVDWIERSLRRSITWALAVNVPFAIVMLVFGHRIVTLWAGAAVAPGLWLLAAMASWTVLNSVNGPLAMFLNGVSAFRFQVVCSVLMTVANVGLAVALTKAYGEIGVVLAMVLAQAVFILIPAAFYVPRLLRSMRSAAVRSVEPRLDLV